MEGKGKSRGQIDCEGKKKQRNTKKRKNDWDFPRDKDCQKINIGDGKGKVN